MIKKAGKQDREKQVLLGLIEHYLKTGKPVGSNTLKDVEFENLSSATIRNYFAHLEKEGFLSQQHSSGGRIPTDRAYRLYAQEYIESPASSSPLPEIDGINQNDSQEIASYLQRAAEKLNNLTNCAVFISAPRFDHDFVVSIKLVAIDAARYLCILVTDFGLIHTEVMHTEHRLNAFSIKRIESYFQWRLTGLNKPALEKGEEEVAIEFYKELMLRYIVSYSHFADQDLYRTGFSSLLSYPEFHNPATLSESLALFENAHGIRLLLKECSKLNTLKFWIGTDLAPYSSQKPECAVLAIPYKINHQNAGAFGILGPTRIPYRKLFDILRSFSQDISKTITGNVVKFKISIRQPAKGVLDGNKEELILLGQASRLLLEDKRI